MVLQLFYRRTMNAYVLTREFWRDIPQPFALFPSQNNLTNLIATGLSRSYQNTISLIRYCEYPNAEITLTTSTRYYLENQLLPYRRLHSGQSVGLAAKPNFRRTESRL